MYVFLLLTKVVLNILEWIEIRNIQSLEDIRIEYTKGANILIADNEVGKSIDKKLDKIMCFPNMYGRGNRKALIRHGKSYGEYVQKLSDYDEPIIFRLYETYQEYKWGSRYWKQDKLPEEIRIALKWIYVEDYEFLMHIMDKDTYGILSNAPAKLNGAILKQIIEDVNLEEAINILHERGEQVSKSIKVLREEYKEYKNLYNSIKLPSINNLRIRLELRRELGSSIKIKNSVLNILYSLQDKPEELLLLPIYHNYYLEILNILLKLNNNTNTIKNLPNYNYINFRLLTMINNMPTKPDAISNLTTYNKYFTDALNIVYNLCNKPSDLIILPNYNFKYLKALTLLSDLKCKPELLTNVKYYSLNLYKALNILNNLPLKPKSMDSLPSYDYKYFNYLELLNKYISAYNIKNNICPLCGNKIRSD